MSNRLPNSDYKAEYPNLQATVSRSGHEFHVDDTPGHERIRQSHKSGTYFEVSSDGRRVELVVADDYKYVKGGLTLTVDGNGDVLVAGNMRLVVQGDLHAEVHGNMTSVVSGDSTSATLGDSVNVVSGDSITKVNGTMNAKVDGNLNTSVSGSAEIDVDGNASLVSKGDIDIEGSNVRITGNQFLTLRGKQINMIKG